MKYECESCGFVTADRDSLGEILHIEMRVEPGEIMPAGECPQCNALVHIDSEKVRAMANAMTMFKALEPLAMANAGGHRAREAFKEYGISDVMAQRDVFIFAAAKHLSINNFTDAAVAYLLVKGQK